MNMPLGDIATYINGFAFKPSDWSDKGLPIIRIQDLTGNSYQANRYNGTYHPKYEVNDGDVLISWSASLGIYVWHGEKSVLNQHIFKVVFDKAEVDKKFFVHQVQHVLGNAASEAHGATMKHLTKPIFDALPFYLPSLEEQGLFISSELKQANLIFSSERIALTAFVTKSHKDGSLLIRTSSDSFGISISSCLNIDSRLQDFRVAKLVFAVTGSEWRNTRFFSPFTG